MMFIIVIDDNESVSTVNTDIDRFGGLGISILAKVDLCSAHPAGDARAQGV
jgi:hypothetical protein